MCIRMYVNVRKCILTYTPRPRDQYVEHASSSSSMVAVEALCPTHGARHHLFFPPGFLAALIQWANAATVATIGGQIFLLSYCQTSGLGEMKPGELFVQYRAICFVNQGCDPQVKTILARTCENMWKSFSQTKPPGGCVCLVSSLCLLGPSTHDFFR